MELTQRMLWCACAVLAGVLLASGISCTSGTRLDWKSVKAKIRATYPGVPQLSTDELARWLADPARKPPVLLDARSRAEYSVSHLEGARWAPDEKAALSALAGIQKDSPIVVYCSVGYRSSDLAKHLIDRGYENVQNLEGSIFEWANQGHPVYRAGRQVSKVHPYDEKWGRLLDRNLWSTAHPHP